MSRDLKAILKRFDEAQAQLVIQTADLPLGTLAEMVEHKSIDLEPAFQRRERWSIDKQSALIESFLLNVPVPPVYLAEEANGTYTAIDGKQRLKAISSFMTDSFSLTNLEKFRELEGYTFNDLPIEIRNPLKLRPFLRVVTLLKQSDKSLKYEVFLRLNRGGESLNNQEIRNVAFRGPMNDAVFKMSKDEFLKEQMKIVDTKSSRYQKMEDVELVLRFLALRSLEGQYNKFLSSEMDRFLIINQNASPERVKEFEDIFRNTLQACKDIWGDLAFKRPEKDGWRDQLLAGMYDAQMLAVASSSQAVIAQAKAKRADVVNATRDLFKDRTFEESVRSGTNTPQRIEYRIRQVSDLLNKVGDA